MPADVERLRQMIRDIPDHPAPGVTFRDITPLLGDAPAFASVTRHLVEQFAATSVDLVVGIEARGFIIGAPVAHALEAGFVPVRKPGKLPWHVAQVEYDLEYGTDCLEMHLDAVTAGQRVLVIDDVLATGGTAAAAIGLIEDNGGVVVGLGVAVEIGVLDGRARLGDRRVESVVRYG